MVKKILKRRHIIVVMLLVLFGIPVWGITRLAVKGEDVVASMSQQQLKEFAKGTEAKVISQDGDVLYSSKTLGYEDTFNLVGIFREGGNISNNTICVKYQDVLLASGKGYHFTRGSSSVDNQTKDIHLTINHKLNKRMYQYMKKQGVKKGSCLVTDVDTGEILAMVSLPSVKPATSFDLDKVEEGSFCNKNLSIVYPGSTQKIFTTALLENESDEVNHYTHICSGGCRLADGSEMKCNTKKGNKDLVSAIGTSCNTYFASAIHTYLDTNPSTTKDALKGMGFLISPKSNQATSLGRLERLQSKTYYDGTGGFTSTWSLIGQQTMLSPLDAVRLVSSLYHEGKAKEPYLVEGEGGGESKLMKREVATKTLEVWQKAFSRFYKGYRQNIMLAKTGTAEIKGQDGSNKLMIGAAKLGKRKVAFFISIEQWKKTKIIPQDVANQIGE